TPLQLLVMKNVVAACMILPLTRAWNWIGWPGVRKMASVSLLLLFTNFCSLVAVKFLPAVTVITLVTTTPAFVALTNQRKGRDVLGRRYWFGFGLCFTGVALSIDALRNGAMVFHPLGLLAVAGSIASSTIYRTRLEDVTSEYKPALVSTYIFLINAVVSLFFVAPFIDPIPMAMAPVGLWIGLAAAVANVAFLSAVHLVGATNMSIFNLLQRPMVLIAATLVLHEHLGWMQWVGIAMIIAGVRIAKVVRK
ncbi:MAG: EamA family transporter, partial [Candidatus Eremiobacteraeota bacterium]|nr:EamA family transporter [Candidatus Eremiobacteraeota bacterium]